MSGGMVDVDYTGERGLTSRQRRILDFICDYYRAEGFPPSIREIGDACGLSSTSSVHHQLNVLMDLGKIRVVSGQSRAIDVRPSLDGGYGTRPGVVTAPNHRVRRRMVCLDTETSGLSDRDLIVEIGTPPCLR